MIWILNRRRLLATTDAIELARVRALLRQSSIPFEVKTTTSRGPMSRLIDVSMAAAARNINSPVSGSGVYGADLTHVYSLYVRRKDFADARQQMVTS
ncbi:MAG: hypothetical protein VB055_07615 [Oscillospiraceae bacterium]|nr:hypothetical protein [Oscillospiraceae bacterium]